MGIKTTKDLLLKTSSAQGVSLLSKSLGKEEWMIKTWINNADLMRVNGVDGIFAELLELSGINSIQALSSADPEKVLEGVTIVHNHISKRSDAPQRDEIEAVINAAKLMI